MGRPAIGAFLLAGLLAPASSLGQDPDRRHDLRARWECVAGHKAAFRFEEQLSFKITVKGGGRVFNREETDLAWKFHGTSEVLKAKDGYWTETRWIYTVATHREEGRDVSYSWENKPLIFTRKSRGRMTVRFESGEELAAEDTKVLQRAESTTDEEAQALELLAEALFVPRKPVRVGDSWNPDWLGVSIALSELGAGSVDIGKCAGTMSLRSVDTRGGALYGRTEGRLDLRMNKVGPVALDHPITWRLYVDFDDCIDGKLPDGSGRVKGDFIGNSGITPIPGGPSYVVEIEERVSGTYSFITQK